VRLPPVLWRPPAGSSGSAAAYGLSIRAQKTSFDPLSGSKPFEFYQKVSGRSRHVRPLEAPIEVRSSALKGFP
jgi:hypothetical protein